MVQLLQICWWFHTETIQSFIMQIRWLRIILNTMLFIMLWYSRLSNIALHKLYMYYFWPLQSAELIVVYLNCCLLHFKFWRTYWLSGKQLGTWPAVCKGLTIKIRSLKVNLRQTNKIYYDTCCIGKIKFSGGIFFKTFFKTPI